MQKKEQEIHWRFNNWTGWIWRNWALRLADVAMTVVWAWLRWRLQQLLLLLVVRCSFDGDEMGWGCSELVIIFLILVLLFLKYRVHMSVWWGRRRELHKPPGDSLCTFAAAWGYRLIHIVACGTSDLIFVRKDVLEARPERGPVPTSRTFPTISYGPVGPIPSTPPPRLRLQASGVTFPAQDDAEGLCALATYQCQAWCRLTCCHKVPQGQISISVWPPMSHWG